MTSDEILKQAIEKAVEGGWDPKGFFSQHKGKEIRIECFNQDDFSPYPFAVLGANVRPAIHLGHKCNECDHQDKFLLQNNRELLYFYN